MDLEKERLASISLGTQDWQQSNLNANSDSETSPNQSSTDKGRRRSITIFPPDLQLSSDVKHDDGNGNSNNSLQKSNTFKGRRRSISIFPPNLQLSKDVKGLGANGDNNDKLQPNSYNAFKERRRSISIISPEFLLIKDVDTDQNGDNLTSLPKANTFRGRRRSSISIVSPVPEGLGFFVEASHQQKPKDIDSSGENSPDGIVDRRKQERRKEMLFAGRELASRFGLIASVKIKRQFFSAWKLTTEAKKMVTATLRFIVNCSYCSSELLRLQREGKTDADLLKESSICRFCKSLLVIEGKQEIWDEKAAINRLQTAQKKNMKIHRTNAELQLERDLILHQRKMVDYRNLLTEAQEREARLIENLHMVDEGNRRIEEHKYEREKKRVVDERKRMVEKFKAQLAKMMKPEDKIDGTLIFDHMVQALEEGRIEAETGGFHISELQERGYAAPLLLCDIIPPEESPREVPGITKAKILKLLSRFEAFAHISESAKERLADAAKLMRYGTGAILDEFADHLYCVCDGEADLYIDEKWANRYDAGKIFGDVGQTIKPKLRPERVACGTQMKLLLIPKDVLRDVFQNTEEIMAALEKMTIHLEDSQSTVFRTVSEEMSMVSLSSEDSKVFARPQVHGIQDGGHVNEGRTEKGKRHTFVRQSLTSRKQERYPKTDTNYEELMPKKHIRVQVRLPGLKCETEQHFHKQHVPSEKKITPEKPVFGAPQAQHHSESPQAEHHSMKKGPKNKIRRTLTMATIGTVLTEDPGKSENSEEQGEQQERSRTAGSQCWGVKDVRRSRQKHSAASRDVSPVRSVSPSPVRADSRMSSRSRSRLQGATLTIETGPSSSTQLNFMDRFRPQTAPEKFTELARRARYGSRDPRPQLASAEGLRTRSVSRHRDALAVPNSRWRGFTDGNGLGNGIRVNANAFEDPDISELTSKLNTPRSTTLALLSPIRQLQTRVASLVEEGMRSSSSFHLKACRKELDTPSVLKNKMKQNQDKGQPTT